MNLNCIKKMFLLILILFFCFSLTGCSNNDETDLLKKKLDKAMKYIDSELLSMLNKLNNISFSTYKLTTEEISSSQKSGQSEGSQSSGGTENKQSGSENSGSSSGGSTSGAEGASQESGSKQNAIVTNMVSNSILLNTDTTIDWSYLKENIENLYTSWTTVIVDLYKIGVNNNDILNFSSTLEQTMISIKNEDKIASLNNLAQLYSYISVYLYSYSTDEILKNNQQTKSNIIKAYSLVEQGDWAGISEAISEAEKYFMVIVNNINVSSEKQSRVNKTYTLLKELQNSISLQNKDVFYVKYKNLIEDVNNIK